MTNASYSTSYLSAAQFLSYYDSRTVAELLSATGVKVADPANDPTMAELLLAASGQVEAAALKGGRYTSADLASIAGTNNGAYLRKLVAGCAMQSLRDRRGRVGEDQLKSFEFVREGLKALRQGEEIFGFVEVQTAATTQSDLDNITNRQARQGISLNASPYFGTRGGDRRY